MTDPADDDLTMMGCPRCGRALDEGGACPTCQQTTGPASASTLLSSGSSSEHLTTTHDLLGIDAAAAHPYRFQAEIGRGGMGRIVRAEDRGLRREVACKLLLDSREPERRIRFLAEAQITGQLEHPNIVPIHGLASDEQGNPFFAMRLVRGDTLETILGRLRAGDKDPRWQLNRLLEYFIGVCNGIGFAHSRGVIHRDLKPGNVMTGEFGQVLVMDWGLAKVLEQPASGRRASVRACAQSPGATHISSIREESPEGTSQTLDGQIMGTAAYMPPEQAAGRVDQLDERSDIYALGAILYEILCLRAPVVGKNIRQVLKQVEHGAITPPDQVAPERGIPRELSAIAMKALSREASDRYQDTRALRADIRAFLDHRPVSASEDRTWDAIRKLVRRNPAASLITAAAALLLVLTTAFGYAVNYAARQDAEAAQATAEDNLIRFQSEQRARRQADAERIAVLEAQAAERVRDWRTVLDHDFNASSPDPGLWQASSGWHDVRTIPVDHYPDFFTPSKAGLRVRGQHNIHLALRRDLGMELRARLEATYHGGTDGGMHLTIGGATWRRGYVFQIGGWRNTAVALHRGSITSNAPTSLAQEPLRLEPGRRYVITAVSRLVEGGLLLRLEVDGEEIISVIDPDPLPGSSGAGDSFALWAANLANTTWHHLRLEQLGEPLRVDLLATAQRHLDLGHFTTARDLFTEVAAVADRTDRRMTAERGLAQIALSRRLHEQLDDWRQRLQTRWPKAVIECYPGTNGYQLSLTGSQVNDLAVIAEMPLEELILRFTTVSDLEPVRGKNLVTFEGFNSHGITDLEPLRGMALQRFQLVNQAVIDLAPLEGMPLEHVYLGDIHLASIEPLRGAPIRTLTLGSPTLQDLDPLRGMPLRSLTVARAPFSDLTILADARLEQLTIAASPELDDLTPLRGHPLQSLAFYHCPSLTDLTPLGDLPLTALTLSATGVDDLGPLAGLDLHTFLCHGDTIRDLGPLAGMPLRKVVVVESPVDDLSPLSESPLHALNLRGCPVTDLTPLRNMPLQELELTETDVTDLSPLRDMPLNSLNIQGCAVTDLRPIAQEYLQVLVITDTSVRDLRPLKGLSLRALILNPDDLNADSRDWVASLPDGTVFSDVPSYKRQFNTTAEFLPDTASATH